MGRTPWFGALVASSLLPLHLKSSRMNPTSSYNIGTEIIFKSSLQLQLLPNFPAGFDCPFLRESCASRTCKVQAIKCFMYSISVVLHGVRHVQVTKKQCRDTDN
eukprot:5074920-Amphidinium_carterae.2